MELSVEVTGSGRGIKHPSQGEVWALLSQKQAPGPEAAQCGLVLGREDSWCGLHPGMELGPFLGQLRMLCSQMTRPIRKSVLESWSHLSLPFQASLTCAPKTALNLKEPGSL